MFAKYLNIKKASLLILPVIFMIIGINFDRTKFSNDPEYAYLLNGINIANLKAVGHTDNPGTTVQIYSAIMLRISHFLNFKEKDELQTAVLKNPDHFIEIERIGLIIINSILLLLLGFFALKFTLNIWFALILQLVPFLSSNLLEHAWTKVSPEAMLFMAANILIMILLKFYYDTDRTQKKYSYLFALVVGFGLATKATFLPMVFLPLIILPLKKQKITYLLAIIPAFVLFTIPAIPQYPHMAKWFLGLSTHTGTYGSGEAGFIDPAKFIKDFFLILAKNAALTGSIIAGIIVFISLISIKSLKRWLHELPASVFLGAIIITQALGILMVAKHYHSNHYLIPVISLVGINLVFGFLILQNSFSEKHSKIKRLLPAIAFFLLLAATGLNIPYLKAADHGYQITNDEYESLQKDLNENYSGYLKTYYYPTSINPYSGLTWGSVYSRNIHLHKLAQLYPDAILFDVRTQSFRLWENEVPVTELIEKYKTSKILVIGGPLTDEELKKAESTGLKLINRYKGRTQAIYEIDAGSLAVKGFGAKPVWSVTFDAENTTDDKKYFISGNYKLENNWHQSTDVAFSGTNCFKLTGQNVYACSFNLDTAMSGNKYQASVWRKGSDDKSHLVVTLANPDDLYLSTSRSISSGKDGWEKLLVEFEVSSNAAGKGLKIYLWNDNKGTACFDDFSVTRIK